MGERANRVLMIAYHYPPFGSSSGAQRTLSFTRHLGDYGWQPIVLTVNPAVYSKRAPNQLTDIPASVPVQRTFALDTARDLSIGGKHFQALALPDRWVSWTLSAVPQGLWLIRKYRPQVLWSSYPIATAHLIGLTLHRLSGIPWVADFRDPMIEENSATGQRWPSEGPVWKAREWIEQRTVRECTRAVFVAPSALRNCSRRYPELPDSRWALIANGYDETEFAKAEKIAMVSSPRRMPIVLLHSGLLYPGGDRDPHALFAALAMLRERGAISSLTLRVVLRASDFEEKYQKQVAEFGLQQIVFLEPAIPYVEALAEMLNADGLLLFQGSDSNSAIPAKYYEYLRARRPILALADAAGDTAVELCKTRVGMIVPLDKPDQIANGLLQFLERIQQKTPPAQTDSEIQSHSRRTKTSQLAQLFDDISHGTARTRQTRRENKREKGEVELSDAQKVVG
jgi:glycosyltransferase involved in cell wall biosynthesis